VQFSLGGARGAALGNLSVDASPDLVIAGQSTSAVFFNDGRGAFGGGDGNPPVIALVGDSPLTVFVGDAYREPGATAVDDVDGNLTAKIAVQGAVNTAVVGVYEVTYDVADSAGNNTRAVRTVRVDPREGTGGGGGATDGWLMLLVLGALAVVVRQRLGAAPLDPSSRSA
jgi:Bacterial surface protein, Ig-like domain